MSQYIDKYFLPKEKFPWVELCWLCDEPTGRAGKAEDSLYREEVGPYCEECWDKKPLK